MTSNRKYEEMLDEDLQNPAEAAQYLSACLESGEPEVVPSRIVWKRKRRTLPVT